MTKRFADAIREARETEKARAPTTVVPDLEHDDDQERAIDLLCSKERCLVITGGPGTGKTTILKRALRDRRLALRAVALAAPTGKAAKRMEQVIGKPAKTVHRLVGYNGTEYGSGEIGEDVVIVDESSMMDVEMGYHLMSSLKAGARLALIGDVDQIPSVAPGSVLRDIIDSKKVPVVSLRTLHRAAAKSWVCTNAQKIIQGEDIDYDTREDFEAFDLSDPTEVVAQVLELMENNKTAFFQGSFQMLSPMRIGDLGTDVLNHIVANYLNPGREKKGFFEIYDTRGSMQHIAAVGDRVIHSQNNYLLNVFNGEIGSVLSVKEKVQVQYPERIVTYSLAQAQRELKLAYVLTVHKSQGSEWDTVAVLCHGSHTRMWNRQLLYTAVTRSKKKVFLIANDEGLGVALVNNNPRERFTTLPARLREWGA